MGGTAEERHLNEERRLAHVAATRAKNKLVFTMFHDTRSVQNEYGIYQDEHVESAFLKELRLLPDDVFRIINKQGM